MKKYPVILFFVAAAMPTAEDFEAAEQLGPNVKFRNASMVPAEGCLEKCDGVAGQVPERYAEAFVSAEDAIAAYEEARKEGAQTPAAEALKPAKATAPKAADKPASASATAKPQAKPAVAWKPNQ